MVIPNITFGLARKLSGFKDDPVDGIVGLAFTSIAVEGVKPPLIAAIDQNILQLPLFTVWLDRRVKNFHTFYFIAFISLKFVLNLVSVSLMVQ